MGVRVPNPGLMGGLESPPFRHRLRRVHLPLKRGRKKTQRLALTFFVNGLHSSNRRWDQAETGITTEPTVDPGPGKENLLCPPGGGPPERSEGEEGEPLLEGTASPFRHRLRRRHLPPQGRRLGSLRCEDSAIYSSTTEWGRLGGGGSQQRHPERSDGEA